MTKIIILVIIFNVVSALIANHNKKKKLEAARNGNENATQKGEVKQNVEVTRTLPKPNASTTYRSKRAALEDDDHARTVADSDQGRDVTSAPGIAAVEMANANAYATLDGTLPTTLSTLRADLLASNSLSRAFILKTVLDKPLSLQSYR